jgi:hypothetical protein
VLGVGTCSVVVYTLALTYPRTYSPIHTHTHTHTHYRLLQWQRWRHAHLKCRDMNLFQLHVTKTQLKDFVEIYAMVYAQCLPKISELRMRRSSNRSIEEATSGHTPDQAFRWKQRVLKPLQALIDRTVSKTSRRVEAGCWQQFHMFQKHLDDRVSSICSLIATHECRALDLDVRLSGISKSDWDQTTSLHFCFEDTLRSVVNFVSERAYVLSCDVHETQDQDKIFAHNALSLRSASVSSKSDINIDEQISDDIEGKTNIMSSSSSGNTMPSNLEERNPDLTMLLQKKGKTFLARTFLPKTHRVCVLNDYSFSFGRATYNVTAQASKTVIPLFMIWKIDLVHIRKVSTRCSITLSLSLHIHTLVIHTHILKHTPIHTPGFFRHHYTSSP